MEGIAINRAAARKESGLHPPYTCLASRRAAPDRGIPFPALSEMLDWCLSKSVRDTGELINPDKGDVIPDSYYFAAAFLDTIGYFDKTKRFWADKGSLPADTEPLRKALIAQLSRFNPDLTVVDTLEQLGAGPRPWSNAIR